METEGGVHTVTAMETRMNSSRMRTDCGSNHLVGGGGVLTTPTDQTPTLRSDPQTRQPSPRPDTPQEGAKEGDPPTL